MNVDTNELKSCFARCFALGCSEHSDMLENQQNHPKMCHRGEIQCTCYYCTIFGHTVSQMFKWLKCSNSPFFTMFTNTDYYLLININNQRHKENTKSAANAFHSFNIYLIKDGRMNIKRFLGILSNYIL